MSARFAALEDRVNRAVFRHLANAEATLSGVGVSGIFEAAGTVSGVGALGMASTQPTFSLPTASVAGDPVGQPLVHAGVAYTVADHEPDGTGVSRLLLEVVA